MNVLATLLALALTVSPEKASRFGAGFERAGEAYVCSTQKKGAKEAGVSWFLRLDQKVPRAVTFAAEALLEEMDETAEAKIYLDIVYDDGTHLWGVTSEFDDETAAGWQRKEARVRPKKPIAKLSAYLMLRGGVGKVRFRNPSAAVVEDAQRPTLDGVALDGGVRTGGFWVRDFPNGEWTDLASSGLSFSSRRVVTNGAERISAELTDRSGRDRAVTLLYALPLGDKPLTWFESPRRERALSERDDEQTEVVSQGCGGGLSVWPFGAVSAGTRGVAIGIEPSVPAMYRVGVSPAHRALYIAFDIGLAPERPSAEVAFQVFDFMATEGFRGALEKYAAINPEPYRVRAPHQGNWMAFHSISNLPHHEDFAFRFKEGDAERDWDDAHGISTFHYTEPGTWWMKLGKPGEGVLSVTRAACAERVRTLERRGDLAARAWANSVVLDAKGRPFGKVRDTPWCNGIVWALNCAPGIAGEVTDFSRKVGDAALAARHDGTGLDGEYVDSANMPTVPDFDFDRRHFAAMRTPLSFNKSGRIGIHKLMMVTEYVRSVGGRMHARGRLAMANTTPVNTSLLAFHLDVMGKETNWKRGGKWSPPETDELLYRRAVCQRKPYCFLQNTDFSKFGYEDSRRYMERCLAYGMFPSYFSANAATGHYFSQPALYERDRPLFKKYLPVIVRLAEAGWRPVNRLVASEDDDVLVEQFGDDLVTVFNPTHGEKRTRLRAKCRASAAQDLMDGTEHAFVDGAVDVTVAAEGVLALKLKEKAK